MNFTVKDIFGFLDSLAPFSLSEEWDNSGLTVGDLSAEVTGITVSLDATADAVAAAVENSSQLLVTHHPMIFHGLSCVEVTSPVYKAISNNIAAIGFHTCYDNADGGVNDVLAKTLSLSEITKSDTVPFMRIGLRYFENGHELAAYVKCSLGGSPRYYSAGKPINRIAVIGGAGEDYIRDAVSSGADALVTGEGSHHDFILARELGITFIAAGHYETENPAAKALYSVIKERFPELSVCYFDGGSPVEH